MVERRVCYNTQIHRVNVQRSVFLPPTTDVQLCHSSNDLASGNLITGTKLDGFADILDQMMCFLRVWRPLSLQNGLNRARGVQVAALRFTFRRANPPLCLQSAGL